MCGIVGLIEPSLAGTGKNRPHQGGFDASDAIRILATLEHRGPDGGGIWIDHDIMLGHRRLAILDPTPDGHQPMSDPTKRYWISFNGEIYNFRELRDELTSLGHRFRTQTDTEVLLAAYAEWGSEAVDRLNGMFAFGIWDREREELFLARDHAGIKPLFYFEEGARLGFASEIKALLAMPRVERTMDRIAIHQFMTYGYVAAPRTGFAGIRQLLPGHCLTYRHGRSEKKCWYRLPYPDRPNTWSLDESSERLDQALSSSVRRQMVSDVPLGAFLSGGLDSTAIVRAMRESQGREAEVHSFSIGFADKSFDESIHAQHVAQRYLTQHHRDTFQAHSFSSLLEFVYHAEDPLADNSMLPLLMLCQSTRKSVKVALSGDGADELLAGYDTYRATGMAQWYRKIPSMMRTAMRNAAIYLPASEKKYHWSSFAKRFVQGADLPFPKNHASWRRMIDPSLATRVFTEQYRKSMAEDPLDAYAAPLSSAPKWADSLAQQLHLDFSFHLPNDMLVKVDRMSMARSLEVRVPWLDREVIETCLGIPSQFKRIGKRGKIVLKRILRRDFAPEFVDRRKAGFVIPVEAWMRNEWSQLLRETLDPSFCRDSGVLEWEGVSEIIEEHATGKQDHAYALFTLLIFGLWYRLWMGRTLSFEPQAGIAIVPATVEDWREIDLE